MTYLFYNWELVPFDHLHQLFYQFTLHTVVSNPLSGSISNKNTKVTETGQQGHCSCCTQIPGENYGSGRKEGTNTTDNISQLRTNVFSLVSFLKNVRSVPWHY